MFINRDYELGLMKKYLEFFITDAWDNTCNIALLGLRRTGKTFILKHFINSVVKKTDLCCQFLDLANICNSPKDFAKNYIIECMRSYTGKTDYDLMELAIETEKKEVVKAVDHFQKELFPRGENGDIIRFAFEFHKFFSDCKWIVVLDEFQEILNLESFHGIKSIDANFRTSLQKHENIFFIISGSYPTILKEWLSDPEKYLFSHFKIISLMEFSKETSCELAGKLIPGLSKSKKLGFYHFSYGNPYVLTVLARRYLLSPQPLEQIFREELFDTGGSLYNYFEYVLNESIKKVRGYGLLKEVLKHISLNETGVTAPQLASLSGKSVEEIHNALKSLLQIDFIYQKDRLYDFRYIPFKYCLRYKYEGLEAFEYEKSTFYEQKVRHLTESFVRVTEELGRAKENELTVEISASQGKTIFGIKIPKFKVIRQHYHINDTEIDIYAETLRGKVWVFELKYKKKMVGLKEINKLIKKIEAYRYIYISKGGYTEEALDEFGNSNKVILIELNQTM